MLILNFTYPLRCLRVPPVEYHCSKLSCTICEEMGDTQKEPMNHVLQFESDITKHIMILL
jgi:hypothetical protein